MLKKTGFNDITVLLVNLLWFSSENTKSIA